MKPIGEKLTNHGWSWQLVACGDDDDVILHLQGGGRRVMTNVSPCLHRSRNSSKGQEHKLHDLHHIAESHTQVLHVHHANHTGNCCITQHNLMCYMCIMSVTQATIASHGTGWCVTGASCQSHKQPLHHTKMFFVHVFMSIKPGTFHKMKPVRCTTYMWLLMETNAHCIRKGYGSKFCLNDTWHGKLSIMIVNIILNLMSCLVLP